MEFTGKNLEGCVPPRIIPDEFFKDFTLNETIPVIYRYADSRTSAPIYISHKDYEQAFAALESRTFSYYEENVLSFYDALDDYSLQDKNVLIYGLVGCNCDAMALWKKAKHVYVVDYNAPISEHENVTVLSHTELESLTVPIDAAFSFSSFEHDGLGRYGDPISPHGDLMAMQSAKKHIRPDGIMFLGVPMGKDCLVWNVHRIYGQIRLPLLLRGWLCLDTYSYSSVELFDLPVGGAKIQPLLVLQNMSELQVKKEDLLERLHYAKSLIKQKKIGTRDGAILQRILEFNIINA